jgi:hypothetical protein
VLCCAVLCCAVLCCAVLCCAVLCCAVLCYAVLKVVGGSVQVEDSVGMVSLCRPILRFIQLMCEGHTTKYQVHSAMCDCVCLLHLIACVC